MPVKQLSDGNPDGTVLGQSANDLISFCGKAPTVAQQVLAVAASDATTTQTLANSIRTALIALGLCR